MIVLRLDKKALMHLIETQPEEVKLELTRGVLAEAARTLVRNIIPEQAEEIVRTFAQQELTAQIGEITSSWPKKKVKLNAAFKRAIQDEVERAAQKAVSAAYKQFEKAMEKKVEHYIGLVDASVDRQFSAILGSGIEKEIRRRVQERLRAAADI